MKVVKMLGVRYEFRLGMKLGSRNIRISKEDKLSNIVGHAQMYCSHVEKEIRIRKRNIRKFGRRKALQDLKKDFIGFLNFLKKDFIGFLNFLIAGFK